MNQSEQTFDIAAHPGRVHHVAVIVRDLDAALGFYRDTLRLELDLVMPIESEARGVDVAGDGEPEPAPGDGRVTASVGRAWHGILLRQPTWRAEAEIRAEYEAGARPDDEIASLGEPDPGRVAIDLAVIDARPADATATDSLLAVEGRDGSSLSLARSLGRLPAYALIGRRYRRLPRG